jgi:hypothetical protein
VQSVCVLWSAGVQYVIVFTYVLSYLLVFSVLSCVNAVFALLSVLCIKPCTDGLIPFWGEGVGY